MTEVPKVILNLSAMDFSGAGKFAVDFHRLLQSVGHQSYLVVKEAKTTEPGVFQYQTNRFDNPVGKLCRRIRKRDWPNDIFQYDFYFYNKYERYQVVSAQGILDKLPVAPDVIFVHWVTDFINARLIQDLKRLTNAKIYWFIIDNSPLTGGCHYPWQCRGFEQNCTNCPAIIPEEYKWLASENLAFRKKYLPADLGIITFSTSDYHRARQSALFRNRRVLKLLGFVDETVFKPGDKAAARHHFGLPDDKKIIFFGASSLKEKRKGMALLLEALSRIDDQNFYLLVAGNLTPLPESLPAKQVGYLTESELIIAYQAADMFVCPSLEDSGPMMINQSLMCGTPVVAFDVGVAQDLVITGKTGYKALTINSESLAEGLLSMVAYSAWELSNLSTTCRAIAVSLAGKETYLSSIESLLHESVDGE